MRKKLLIPLGILLVLCVGVLAYWMATYNSVTSFSITGSSGDPLTIQQDFVNASLDLSSGEVISQKLIIANSGETINVTFTKDVTFIPADPACSDLDLEVTFGNYLGNYTTGDIFKINAVLAEYDLEISAPHGVRSCEGEIIVELSFEEVVQ